MPGSRVSFIQCKKGRFGLGGDWRLFPKCQNVFLLLKCRISCKILVKRAARRKFVSESKRIGEWDAGAGAGGGAKYLNVEIRILVYF